MFSFSTFGRHIVSPKANNLKILKFKIFQKFFQDSKFSKNSKIQNFPKKNSKFKIFQKKFQNSKFSKKNFQTFQKKFQNFPKKKKFKIFQKKNFKIYQKKFQNFPKNFQEKFSKFQTKMLPICNIGADWLLVFRE